MAANFEAIISVLDKASAPVLALPLGRIMMFHEQAARIVAERNRAAR